MRAKILSTIMVVSFIVYVITFMELNMAFWVSLFVFSFSCLYANRHEKALNQELDDLFGKDDDLV